MPLTKETRNQHEYFFSEACVQYIFEKNIFFIKVKKRMIGHLNAPSPFDDEGWYCTKDNAKLDNEKYLTITGSDSDVINISGLKFLPWEVELECLSLKEVKFAEAYGINNPITGQYLELSLELNEQIEKEIDFKNYVHSHLKKRLPRYLIPSRIKIGSQVLSHRF